MMGSLLGGVAHSRERCADACVRSSRFAYSRRYYLTGAQNLNGGYSSYGFVSIDQVAVDEYGEWRGMELLLRGVCPPGARGFLPAAFSHLGAWKAKIGPPSP